MLALLAAGVPADHPQVAKTLDHFRGQQNADGGFPYVSPSPYGTDSDSNSTAVVMWAIAAAGQDPAGDAWKYQGQDGKSPLDRLRAFQNEDGAFRWQDAVPDDNMLSTVQAPVALALKTLPFAYMDVGPATAATATDETAATEATAAPQTTLPETGANLWAAPIALLAGGTLLIGIGKALRGRAVSR
jgi:hypothetical protein